MSFSSTSSQPFGGFSFPLVNPAPPTLKRTRNESSINNQQADSREGRIREGSKFYKPSSIDHSSSSSTSTSMASGDAFNSIHTSSVACVKSLSSRPVKIVTVSSLESISSNISSTLSGSETSAPTPTITPLPNAESTSNSLTQLRELYPEDDEPESNPSPTIVAPVVAFQPITSPLMGPATTTAYRYASKNFPLPVQEDRPGSISPATSLSHLSMTSPVPSSFSLDDRTTTSIASASSSSVRRSPSNLRKGMISSSSTSQTYRPNRFDNMPPPSPIESYNRMTIRSVLDRTQSDFRRSGLASLISRDRSISPISSTPISLADLLDLDKDQIHSGPSRKGRDDRNAIDNHQKKSNAVTTASRPFFLSLPTQGPGIGLFNNPAPQSPTSPNEGSLTESSEILSLPKSVTSVPKTAKRFPPLNTTITFMAEGSFHNIFTIEGRPNQLLRVVNDKSHSDLRILEPRKHILATGYASYKKLEAARIRVPQIYNNPIEDGYYLIENIPQDPKVALWTNPSITLKALDRAAMQQLQEVKLYLDQMDRQLRANPHLTAGELDIPDFKPHNVKVNARNQLVVIDFCETTDRIAAFHRPAAIALKEYVESWANGNPHVLAYLKKGMHL